MMMSSGLSRIRSKDSSRPQLEWQHSSQPALPPVCPGYGADMVPRKCKLLCMKCGYFESCADLI